MDDSSATTEASGLTSDPDTTETLTPARPAASDETLLRVAERLRGYGRAGAVALRCLCFRDMGRPPAMSVQPSIMRRRVSGLPTTT